MRWVCRPTLRTRGQDMTDMTAPLGDHPGDLDPPEAVRMALLATEVAMALGQATVVAVTPAPRGATAVTVRCTLPMDPLPCMVEGGPLLAGGILGTAPLGLIMGEVAGPPMDTALHVEEEGEEEEVVVVVVTMDATR